MQERADRWDQISHYVPSQLHGHGLAIAMPVQSSTIYPSDRFAELGASAPQAPVTFIRKYSLRRGTCPKRFYSASVVR
jgi:hypothetical protein